MITLLFMMVIQFNNLIDIEGIDYDSLDLNKLSNEEIAMHKRKMDKLYEKNFVKPGDP